jgi:hypothetical protein
MKSFKITMPCGRAFTMITEEPASNIAAAIFERFRVLPVAVVAL